MEQNENLDERTSRKRKRTDSETDTRVQKEFDLKKLSKEHIVQCISAIFHLTQEQLKTNKIVEEIEPVFLQINCIKVPQIPRRQMRM
jgi:hypothetical protein